MTLTPSLARPRRLARAAVAGGVAIAGVALAVPAGASGATTFVAEYANAEWTSADYQVEIAPGEHNDRGKKTEYLNSKISASYCTGGNLYQVALEKREEAKDLKGVDVRTTDIGEAKADVNRKTAIPGTLTKTPVASDCTTPTGEATVVDIEPTVEIKAEWKPAGAPVAYSGEDCGGDGSCNYVDAVATGKVSFHDRTFDLGKTQTDTWLWNGTWVIA